MKLWIRAAFALIAAATIAGCSTTATPDPTPLPQTATVDTMPSSRYEKTIDSMKVGESGYTTPWAMWVDLDSHMWLHPKYPVEPSIEGTVDMRVERRDDGFHVWPPADEKYTPVKEPHYAGEEGLEWIRVVALEDAP